MKMKIRTSMAAAGVAALALTGGGVVAASAASAAPAFTHGGPGTAECIAAEAALNGLVSTIDFDVMTLKADLAQGYSFELFDTEWNLVDAIWGLQDQLAGDQADVYTNCNAVIGSSGGNPSPTQSPTEPS
jgi:hypothetical protein